jgi:adenine-specific DNA-methyltransferase
MPTLDFKGKPFVYSHHLSVPFRELIFQPDKSLLAEGGAPSIEDNLIIHGDNLEALKALLPRYAGKVDVIYIDPPYNTGNEGWAYNDNVNATALKAWFGKVVDAEDLERHDKWLCMMWPRLQLLHELLSDRGIFWINLDDNEVHNAAEILDEIFGSENRLASAVWEKGDSPRMDAEYFSNRHDALLVYAKDKLEAELVKKQYAEDTIPDHYDKTDENGRRYYLKPLRSMGGQGERREARPNLFFPLTTPDGKELLPKLQDGSDGTWRWSREKVAKNPNKIEWLGQKGKWTPYFRIYADENKGRPPETIFFHKDVGSSRTAKAQLKQIFGGKAPFETPKPVGLVRELVRLSSRENSIVLDSFAGSGTTAHAVMELNKADGGNRRFILVETEDYADVLTAERVRRVINGVPGAKDEALKRGLGGSFSYCDLGEPMDLERFFGGDGKAPAWDQVAKYVAFTATGQTLDTSEGPDGFAGYAGPNRLHLLYRPDSKWMRSNESMLDLTTAERIAEAAKADGDRPVLVFAAGKLMGQRTLTQLGITFCQLPYSVHRILGEGTEGVAGADAA